MAINFFRKNRPTVLTPRPPLPGERGRNAPLSFRRGAGGEDFHGHYCRQFKLSAIGRALHATRLHYLLLLLCPLVGMAQNGVTISNLILDAGTVTFDVCWGDKPLPAVWSDSVWVFVDYNNAGKMERLPLLSGATLIQTSAPGYGRVERLSNNDQGVRVIGDARSAGSFSATVKVQTPKLGVFAGACVYASNYPPVGTFFTDGEVTFTGTPGYDLTVKYEGRTFTLPADGTYKFPAGYTLISFHDKTGAPGIIITHAAYCHPGIVGGSDVYDTPLNCALYVAGAIGGEDSALPGCASYAAGAIGGATDAVPSCAAYRAGSIGGLSFVGLYN